MDQFVSLFSPSFNHLQDLYDLKYSVYQGTVKQTINFSEPEGQPVSIDVCGNYLVIGTNIGLVRVYDLSRR